MDDDKIYREGQAGKTIIEPVGLAGVGPVPWLWKDWLARGMLHLMAGAPGCGKTTLSLSFAATISAGGYWPDGTHAPAGNVAFWTGDDGLACTIKPRLMRMGADFSKILFIPSRRFNLATDMPWLAEAAHDYPGGFSLVVIDPIIAAIDAETRNSLQPAADFAEATGAAVLGITPFTISRAFGALAQVVMVAAECEGRGGMPRILTRTKSNIGLDGGGFRYGLEAGPLRDRPDIIATRVAWIDVLEGKARKLLEQARARQAWP